MRRELPIGALLGALGAALLAVSLFLDWWEELTAFTVFELLDLVLLALALVTIAALASGLGLLRASVRPAVSIAVALTALFLVVSQLVNDPPAVASSDIGHELGIWLALAGAALMVAGALLGMARLSLAVDVTPREPRRSDAPADPDAPTAREQAAPPGATSAGPGGPPPADGPERR